MTVKPTSLAQFDAEHFIPHRRSMVLLDKIIFADETRCISQLEIHANSLFANEQGVPSWVGIEYMAQTIAAFAGVQARAKAQEPEIGFLLGTRSYQVQTPLFKIGQKLQISATHVLTDNSLTVFACSLHQGVDEPWSGLGTLIAEARINAYLPDPDTLKTYLA
ncbi:MULTISPECIES: 3-hydroxydecanoyl-ACP dehydratase [unclassified Motilimonas]|uniref:ApeP family dehydratase n=1 Tax=Motilimonas TaxID=1914248 RepID=UPI001E59CDF6|nr:MULTISPECIES: 3-hydroxydecanoyl-ACP dehydratase [unclassified Motilimonas]MCE0556472.1 3-hydroxydecanoyl-ACP dehydratase [Motilimonas sp. E26]MDO6527101.1 3-hydroxydecanoyl-ACP dehydratase [Motilimonas sp. 1_MG-2023]